VTAADPEELQRHEAMLDLIHKSSGGKAVWRVPGAAEALPMAANSDQTHRNH
jgi:hypothetical protein